MYTKEEASAVRQKFWTGFGRYMQPVPSASGEKINWVNYKTGIKGISFKMNADNNRAMLAVEISTADEEVRMKYFGIFLNFKKAFEQAAGKDWDFTENFATENGLAISRISTELNGINIFRESDWPQIISFLKKNMIALDGFWNEYQHAFDLVI